VLQQVAQQFLADFGRIPETGAVPVRRQYGGLRVADISESTVLGSLGRPGVY
jgi:hypothetical protein